VKPTVRASFVAVFSVALLLILMPTAVAARTAAVQSGLKVEWHRVQTTGLGVPYIFTSLAYAKGTYVAADSAYNQGARIWFSSDARNWQLAWRGHVVPYDIVPGGPGFVAWSEGVLLSNNGRNWTHVTDGVPQRLLDSDFTRLANVGDAVVAFPDSGHSYWSTDGRNWNGIGPGAGPQGPIALAGDGAHLWALTGGRNFEGGVDQPVDVWVTDDGQHWTQSGQLPRSRRVSEVTAAFGPRGGVVIAGAKAWFAADNVHWHVAANTPTITSKGRDFIDAAVGDDAGFIVVAHRDPPGCAIDPAQRRALTFTSVDGKVWREMSEKGWKGREIDQLLINGRTLIGVGIDWRNDLPSADVWNAQLPALATDNAPPPPPPDNPGPGGCGP
jgi:hypothetical protein